MENKISKINWTEFIIGLFILIGAGLLGEAKLAGPMLLFRLIMGISLGYILSRAYTGFAGSVNRAYNGGSTRLMRAMAMMFFVTALLIAGFLMFNKNEAGEAIVEYGLWINPINMGLILGGLLFGFGMAFSSCCASGVMTDLATDFPKALITVIFFGLGVFLGMPLQNTASWIKESWFHSASYENGVFLPDLFAGTALNGYIGALVLTGIFCIIMVAAASYYESHRRRTGRYKDIPSEAFQYKNQSLVPAEKDKLPGHVFRKIFVDPWTLETGALLIAISFGLMFAVTKSGWGASTPYGLWFAKALTLVGFSPEALAGFTHGKAEAFAAPFLPME